MLADQQTLDPHTLVAILAISFAIVVALLLICANVEDRKHDRWPPPPP